MDGDAAAGLGRLHVGHLEVGEQARHADDGEAVGDEQGLLRGHERRLADDLFGHLGGLALRVRHEDTRAELQDALLVLDLALERVRGHLQAVELHPFALAGRVEERGVRVDGVPGQRVQRELALADPELLARLARRGGEGLLAGSREAARDVLDRELAVLQRALLRDGADVQATVVERVRQDHRATATRLVERQAVVAERGLAVGQHQAHLLVDDAQADGRRQLVLRHDAGFGACLEDDLPPALLLLVVGDGGNERG